jgi:hypothetical protein
MFAPVQLPSLPGKFEPFILTDANPGPIIDGISLKDRMDAAFAVGNANNITCMSGEKSFSGEKSHIRKFSYVPGYFIKTQRKDHFIDKTTPDTHLYRVRKANKIRKAAEKYGFSHLIAVPTKWVYKGKQEWIVLSEELPLSKRELKPYTSYAHTSNTSYDELTPEQARALSILAFETNLNDLGSHNLAFTEDRRVAIVDTEPWDRRITKDFSGVLGNRFPFDHEVLRVSRALDGTLRLKRCCSNPAAVREIMAVEKEYYKKTMIKAVMRLALGVLALLATIYIAKMAYLKICLTLSNELAKKAGVSISVCSVLFLVNKVRQSICNTWDLKNAYQESQKIKP